MTKKMTIKTAWNLFTPEEKEILDFCERISTLEDFTALEAPDYEVNGRPTAEELYKQVKEELVDFHKRP
jgi:hypothetical protein